MSSGSKTLNRSTWWCWERRETCLGSYHTDESEVSDLFGFNLLFDDNKTGRDFMIDS